MLTKSAHGNGRGLYFHISMAAAVAHKYINEFEWKIENGAYESTHVTNFFSDFSLDTCKHIWLQ